MLSPANSSENFLSAPSALPQKYALAARIPCKIRQPSVRTSRQSCGNSAISGVKISWVESTRTSVEYTHVPEISLPSPARWLASASSEAMSESRYAPYPAIRYVPVITAQSRNTAAANRPPSRFCLIVASSAFRLAFVSIVLLYHRRKRLSNRRFPPLQMRLLSLHYAGEISIFLPFNLFVSPNIRRRLSI